MKPVQLSPRRRQVLEAIARRRMAGLPSPSRPEISAELGLSGVRATYIWRVMDELARDGLLVRLPGHQGVDLTDDGWAAAGIARPTPADAPIAAAVREALAMGEPLPARVVAALEAVA